MNRKPSTLLALALLAWASMSQSLQPARPIVQPILPAHRTAVVGSDVQFECKVLADPQPHIQWLKHIEINSSSVDPNGLPYVRVLESVYSDEDAQVLRLTNVSLDDTGKYICLAGNSVGFSYHSVMLTVLEDIEDSATTCCLEGESRGP